MADRGFNQDEMRIGGRRREREAGYPSEAHDEEEEVHDLGFIIDDHDDRRISLVGGWQRLDDLDTDEALETNRSGPLPHEVSRRERGAPEEWFATDYHIANAEAEEQEEDFVETSMLRTDPEMDEGVDDFTDETMHGIHGELISTDLRGHVTGVGYGFGTSLPQDFGLEGFQIRDNPLMQPEGRPVSDENVSDVALGLRDVDEMGSDEELDRLADRAAREAEREEEEGQGGIR